MGLATVPGFPKEVANQVFSYGANEPLTYNFPALAAMDKPAETFLIADASATLSGWGGHGGWVDAERQGAPENDPRRQRVIARIAYPSEPCAAAAGHDGQDYWSGNYVAKAKYDPCARHSNGTNIGFADGHAKFTQSSRTRVGLFGVK